MEGSEVERVLKWFQCQLSHHHGNLFPPNYPPFRVIECYFPIEKFKQLVSKGSADGGFRNRLDCVSSGCKKITRVFRWNQWCSTLYWVEKFRGWRYERASRSVAVVDSFAQLFSVGSRWCDNHNPMHISHDFRGICVRYVSQKLGFIN